MKRLKRSILILMISLLTTPLVYAESDTAEEKAAQEEMYEAYGQLCFSGKDGLKAIDFLSLPKGNANSLAPIDWVKKLENYYDIILTPSNKCGKLGSKYSWVHGDLRGIVKIATYSSPSEAQIGLADILVLFPVKLGKGTFGGVHIGDACFHGTSSIYFVRKNFLVSVSGKDKSSQALLLAINRLAETIDNSILTSKLLLKETTPFEVVSSNEWFNVNEEVTITITSKENDRPFTVYCDRIKGRTTTVNEQFFKPELKKEKSSQSFIFGATKSGDGTLKVYVCEKSGMVWTCYIRFNVFHGN